MGEILNVVGDIAMGTVKTVAAERANKFLVDNVKAGLVRTGMISPETADNEQLDMALSVILPAAIIWGSVHQKEFLSNQIGSENVKRIRELAKIAIRTQGMKVVKPLLGIGVPLIKGFLTQGFTAKELPSAVTESEPSVKVVQENVETEVDIEID